MIASIASAALAIGSQVYGAIASGKAKRKAQAEFDKQRQENKDWYNREMNTDYTSRSDVQNILNKQKETLADFVRSARATNAVAGGTEESEALARKQALDSIADSTAQISADASAHKDAVEQAYRSDERAFAQAQADAYQQQAAGIQQSADSLSKTFGNLGSALNQIPKKGK